MFFVRLILSLLGFQFIKVPPTEFVLHFRGGRVVREGAGLAFFYFAPTASLVRVPVGSVDVPFMFEDTTADFQAVTVQGQLTYRIADAKKLAQLMNFTVGSNGRDYTSEDPAKLPQRLINLAQVSTQASIRSLSLRAALSQSDAMVLALHERLRTADAVSALGVEVLGVSILAIKPMPETARALEAEAREDLMGKADEAIYARRNAAVEQERAIKENELNTEVAVETKRRQIRETQMAAQIAIEEQKKKLVSLSTANAREESDARAYAVSAMMQSLRDTDPQTLQALASVGMQPAQLVALAFKELAQGAERIGQLNVSPDLLQGLLQPDARVQAQQPTQGARDKSSR